MTSKNCKIFPLLLFFYTQLHEASQNGHENCVEILLNHDDVKQSVDNQTFEGATCAFLAAANGHSDVLQLLLDNGASVNESNFAAVPPISIAAQNNRVDCLKVSLSLFYFFVGQFRNSLANC